MLRKLALLALLSVLAAPAVLEAQTEIAGSVLAVDGRNVTIRVPGDLLPRQGDEVRLRFRDPVPGAGLVFLDGTWEVTAVRGGDVEAVPRGETAVPQEGLVALISSENPQPRAALPEQQQAPAAAAAPPTQQEPAVAAVVRERDSSGVERIERRRWIGISAGGGLVSLRSPTFYGYAPKSEISPRLTASVGIFLLPNLAVSGYLGTVSAEGEAGGSTQSATEIYKVVGATLYSGTPGNVPGDVHTFVQGGYAWYDVHYGGAGGDPEATGTGFFAGAGVLITVRRGFGLYVAGQYLPYTYDEAFTVFDRVPAEVSAGATVIIG